VNSSDVLSQSSGLHRTADKMTQRTQSIKFNLKVVRTDLWTGREQWQTDRQTFCVKVYIVSFCRRKQSLFNVRI